MMPFGMGLGSGLGLPMMGAAIIAASAFLAYGVSSIKSAGAAASELQRIEEVAIENRKSAEQYKTNLLQVQASERKARLNTAKAKAEAKRLISRIRTIPRTKDSVTCPIDCTLPSSLPSP